MYVTIFYYFILLYVGANFSIILFLIITILFYFIFFFDNLPGLAMLFAGCQNL